MSSLPLCSLSIYTLSILPSGFNTISKINCNSKYQSVIIESADNGKNATEMGIVFVINVRK